MSDMLATATPAVRKQASEAAATNRTVLGFWIYLMTDCILFASLFATYAVLHGNTNGQAGARELFNLPYALVETYILLLSSFSCGLMMLGLHQRQRRLLFGALTATLLLGVLFVGMEVTEFHHLIVEGHSWRSSGFLSAYFTLVATHGLHICFGLLWGIVLFVQLLRKGLGGNTVKRLTLFSMFWHFLDVVWVFIFSMVYLWGKLL